MIHLFKLSEPMLSYRENRAEQLLFQEYQSILKRDSRNRRIMLAELIYMYSVWNRSNLGQILHYRSN